MDLETRQSGSGKATDGLGWELLFSFLDLDAGFGDFVLSACPRRLSLRLSLSSIYLALSKSKA